ncbi:hypothetical protein [Hydrogenophaga sp.]|uniref:hypothetical protein n=1 Tax=Hydrogenophaga sp. TaxID=1904254 RepID=UPI002FCA86A0
MSHDRVFLRLGATATWLARDGDEEQGRSLALDLGSASTAQRFFRGDLPTPLELERAIDHVEDELMRATAWTAGRSTLVTDHPLVRALAQAEGQAGAVLTRDVVEGLFQRLASGALGDPSALRGLPAGKEAAASLLILRELMHHLGFSQVEVAPPSPGAALP